MKSENMRLNWLGKMIRLLDERKADNRREMRTDCIDVFEERNRRCKTLNKNIHKFSDVKIIQLQSFRLARVLERERKRRKPRFRLAVMYVSL